MANWIDNKVIISRNEELEMIFDLHKETELGMMETLVGKTDNPDHKDWDEANIEYWGTERDVMFCDVEYKVSDKHIHLRFETNWSPPRGFIDKLIDRYNISIEIYYVDPYDCFSGAFYYEDSETYGSFHKDGERIEMDKLYEILKTVRRKDKVNKIIKEITL